MRKLAFIWDLDGTLLDSYKVIVPSLHQTLREFSIDMDESAIHKELITYSLGVFLSKVEEETGIEAAVIRKRFSEINNSRALDTVTTPNAAEILLLLKNKGILNFVYTHKGSITEPVLKNTGLFDFFEEIISGKDGFPKKPDPAALNYLVRKYSLDKDSTFYVGDRTLDIACANNAGIRSILYLPDGSPAQSNGTETYTVKDLLEIAEILEKEKVSDPGL